MRRTARPVGPGAMAVARAPARTAASRAGRPARRLALLIAVGIGLHNFAEGLAIGQSAARGEIGLATLLVIGFALHNATEGFGIVAPLAGRRHDEDPSARPSWALPAHARPHRRRPDLRRHLGRARRSPASAVSVVFLTLAAGSIIYVVVQLLGVAARAKRQDLLCLRPARRPAGRLRHRRDRHRCRSLTSTRTRRPDPSSAGGCGWSVTASISCCLVQNWISQT